ncbi:MAG: HYExAFE family protein, partial [Planctomycetota bacterium]
TSFAKLTSFECWVTADDVDGLARWQQVFGPDHTAVFVFAYKIENIDVDFDGRDVYDFAQDRYIFFAVKLDDYRKFMKRRSPKWQTVTLPADKFRQCAVQMQNLLL